MNEICSDLSDIRSYPCKSRKSANSNKRLLCSVSTDDLPHLTNSCQYFVRPDMESDDAEPDGSEKIVAIQALHADLAALSEFRIPNIEKLCAELDAHIEAFRNLLDHKPKSDASRAKLKNGMHSLAGLISTDISRQT